MDISVFSELIANLISFLFGMFEGVDLSPIAKAIETLTPYIKAALYLLPTETIAQIFTITCALWSLRLTIKSIILLWNLLPMYQKHINDLKAVYEELESIRRTFSNQQHNTKEELKNKDHIAIDETLTRLEKTGTTAHELIKEVLWRMPELSIERELNLEYER